MDDDDRTRGKLPSASLRLRPPNYQDDDGLRYKAALLSLI